MDLEHSFTVPVDVDTAWAEFQDIASVAECFPGATVAGVDGESFNGSVKVKLGPIALVYNGSGTFTEKDDANHRFVVDAKGKDKRGNGTAGATVTLTMSGNGDSTDVKVHTDLAITGKPAQFGRGVMQDVSDKLLGQFIACLEQRLDAGGAETSPASSPATTAEASDAAGSGAAGTATAGTTAPPDAATAAGPVGTAAETASAPTPPSAPSQPSGSAQRPATSSRGSDEALDLGKTVLPVLVKNYWKPVLIALVVIIVIIWIITR